MATEIKITKEHNPMLYDSDTGESLKAEKVVDITNECPARGERVLLLYTRATRGRIVQVTFPYEKEAYRGSHLHFFFDEPPIDTFDSTARRLGLSTRGFQDVVRANAPA